MARIISFEGREISVPDDATDDEIASIIDPTPQPQTKSSSLTSIMEQPRIGGMTIPVNPLPALNGIAQGGANVISGMGASALAGLRGLGTLATGGSMDEASQNVKDTQNKYTFEPRTAEGAWVARAAGLPIELGSKAAGYVGGEIGQAVGGDQGRIAGQSIGEASVPIAATIAGGVGALRGAKSAGMSIAEANKAKMAALAEERLKNSVLDETRKRVVEAGFINPAEGGLKNTISGLAKTNPRISAINEGVATDLAAKTIGVKVLSPETLAARQAELNVPYDNIIKAGFNKVDGLKTPPEMVADLNKILGDIKTKVAYDPETFGSLKAAVPLLEQQLAKDVHHPQLMMEQIKQLRKDAKTNALKGDDPNKLVLSSTQRGLADMLEGVFEYNLKDQPALLKAFKEARANKAQVHFVDQIYNDATGKVDIQKAASLSEKNPLTGGLKTIADFGKAYPEASARVRSQPNAVGIMDALFAAGSFAAGHPGLALGELGSRIAVPMAASRGILSTKQPTYNLPLSARAAQGMFSTPALDLLKSNSYDAALQRQKLGYDGLLSGEQQ